MQEPTVPSNRNILPSLQSPLGTPSAHQVVVLQPVALQQSRGDTHHGTHILRKHHHQGHGQRYYCTCSEARRTCDKRIIILYQDLSCVGDALWKWDVWGQGLDW